MLGSAKEYRKECSMKNRKWSFVSIAIVCSLPLLSLLFFFPLTITMSLPIIYDTYFIRINGEFGPKTKRKKNEKPLPHHFTL